MDANRVCAFHVFLKYMIERYVIKRLFVLCCAMQLHWVYIIHTERRNRADRIRIYRLVNVIVFKSVCVRACMPVWVTEWMSTGAHFNRYIGHCVACVLFIHTCRAHSLSRYFSELILRFVPRKRLTTNNNIINMNNREILTIVEWWLY